MTDNWTNLKTELKIFNYNYNYQLSNLVEDKMYAPPTLAEVNQTLSYSDTHRYVTYCH